MSVAAVVSMLHEPAGAGCSAGRLFRQRPVLWWTLERLSRSRRLESMAILCWEDQLPEVEPVAGEQGGCILAKGPRVPLPQLEASSAALRWCDGWRGGPGQVCAFDRGFHGRWLLEICDNLECEAVMLADASAGLIDPVLVDAMLEHAEVEAGYGLCFSPAAPGLSGVLLRRVLLERLIAAGTSPGRLLHYTPEQPRRDALSEPWCAPVPAAVARTPYRFTLDSERQVRRIEAATMAFNGQLLASEAEVLVSAMRGSERVDALPREVVLELNVDRATRPLWWPGLHLKIERETMPLTMIEGLLKETASADDIRLTLAGVGDPLLSPVLFDVIEAAQRVGVRGIHVETDLLGSRAWSVERIAPVIERLVSSGVDVVSVHVPATARPTYQRVMGVEGLETVLENVRMFAEARRRFGRGVPLLAPTFVKCRENLGEMELWYDQWLKATGSAVIVGPGTYAGQVPDHSVAEMAPPQRSACGRLSNRMTVLCDGTVVACEQDVAGRHPVGQVGKNTIEEVWRVGMARLRAAHERGQWEVGLCGGCCDWHR